MTLRVSRTARVSAPAPETLAPDDSRVGSAVRLRVGLPEEGESSLGTSLVLIAVLLLTVGVWLFGAVAAIELALRALT